MQVAEGLQRRGVELRIGARASGVARGERRPHDRDAGGRRAADAATACSSRSAAACARTSSGWRRSGWSRASRSRSTTRCASPGSRGSTRSATSTAARSSRTWASTRRASRSTRSAATSLRVRRDGPLSPRAIFTDPGVAAVGHTLASAQEAGIAARAVDRDTSGTAGASFHGRNAPGTTRFVLDAERELLVGATFVGPDVAELLHAATIAIVGEVPLATLAARDPRRSRRAASCGSTCAPRTDAASRGPRANWSRFADRLDRRDQRCERRQAGPAPGRGGRPRACGRRRASERGRHADARARARSRRRHARALRRHRRHPRDRRDRADRPARARRDPARPSRRSRSRGSTPSGCRSWAGN